MPIKVGDDLVGNAGFLHRLDKICSFDFLFPCIERQSEFFLVI